MLRLILLHLDGAILEAEDEALGVGLDVEHFGGALDRLVVRHPVAPVVVQLPPQHLPPGHAHPDVLPDVSSIEHYFKQSEAFSMMFCMIRADRKFKVRQCWGFVQLMFFSRWAMNQLNKIPNFA